MSVANDYYALLRVSPEADGATIRTAYRALMRLTHPDVNGSDDAAARAKAINEAYACLRNADKRASYDWLRTQPPINPQPSPAPPRPQRPKRPRPMWSGPTPLPEPPMQWFKPTWGNAVGLGIAALVTAITFTITSTIPPVPPAEAKRSVEVRMRVVPGTSGATGTNCGGKRTSASHAISAECPI